MAETTKIIATVLILALLASAASAFSFQDLIDTIKGLFGMGSDSGEDTQPQQVVCTAPYMRVGNDCCLDKNSNNICDEDEKKADNNGGAGGAKQTTSPKKTTTTKVATTQATQTTAKKNAVTTTVKNAAAKPTVDVKSITLEGKPVADVDPVFTNNKQKILIPTNPKLLEIVDASSMSHNAVALSAEVYSGVDAVPLKSGKAIIPTMSGRASKLDIVDVASGAVTKSLDLYGLLQVDVDAVPNPSETKALVATRADTSNSFLEIVDLGSNSIAGRINMAGDLKEGVDAAITGDGKRAMIPVLKGTGVGTTIYFIDVDKVKTLKALGVDGRAEEDVDLKVTSNGEMLLAPTTTPALGYLSLIEAKTMTIQKKLTLSGILQKSCDVYFLPGERQAYIPVNKGSQGMLDIIDVYTKQILHSVRLSGMVHHGVDAKATPNGKKVVVPTQQGTKAYIDIVDPSAGTVLHKIQLSGTLKTAVDVQITQNGKTAYMPVQKPSGVVIDVIDIGSGKITNTLEASGQLVSDLDGLLTNGASELFAVSDSATGHLSKVKIPSQSISVLTNAMGQGYVHVFNTQTNSKVGESSLPGMAKAGVDMTSAKEATTTPHFDEDMVMEADDQTVFTTTTWKLTTTTYAYTTTTYYYTTTTLWEYGTTTIPDTVYTTTTQPDDGSYTTTTIEDGGGVVTPRCGDGYLSWYAMPGGGSEECDPNTGPYNDWEGARKYDCPPGLECKDCKCVGCGDGRLQSGEECDNNNKKVTFNGEPIWVGQKYECDSAYDYCNSDCECESSVDCEASGMSSEKDCGGQCKESCESCVKHPEVDCYICESDCEKLGQGWGELRDICPGCNDAHSECIENEECTDCYQCVETCPRTMDYYRFEGCDAKCDSRLCKKVGKGEYKDCYQCTPPVCGDDIISPPDEQCEKDSDCKNSDAYCDDCKCVFDCTGYCAAAGNNGYQVAGGITSSAACKAEAQKRGAALSKQCRVTCSASSFASYTTSDGTQSCCCVDAAWKPCLNCPCTVGVNCPADCTTPVPQCKAEL